MPRSRDRDDQKIHSNPYDQDGHADHIPAVTDDIKYNSNDDSQQYQPQAKPVQVLSNQPAHHTITTPGDADHNNQQYVVNVVPGSTNPNEVLTPYNNTVEKLNKRRPLWQRSFIAGIDPEVQMMAHDMQYDLKTSPVVIREPISPNTTLCLNFGLAVISLFSSFLFIISSCALAFSAWATHQKATPLSIAMTVVCAALVAFSVFLAFRNMCFRVGGLLSIVVLFFIALAQLGVALLLTIWPLPTYIFAAQTDLPRHVKEPAQLDTATSLDNTTIHPIDAVLRDLLKNKRDSIATYINDNLLLLRAITWLSLLCQVVTIGYLIFSYNQLRKRKYYIEHPV